MKFGRKYGTSLPSSCTLVHTIVSLPRNQVPEWAASYINYKGLKKLVKAAALAAKNGEKVDLAGGTSPDEHLGVECVA